MKAINESSVLDALSRHIGSANGVTARDLVVEITGKADTPGATRRLRRVIESLREKGMHICGHPGSGYYMAADDRDVAATCEFLYSRAMTSLKQICRMKRISMPDIRGQLKLPT
jgi:hypothetical protein